MTEVSSSSTPTSKPFSTPDKAGKPAPTSNGLRAASRPVTAALLRRLLRVDGQATVEYALVLLAAAGLAAALLAWAVGSDGISRLMNAVVDSIISDATAA